MAGGAALPLAGDVTDAEFRSRVVEETVERFGGLDHLVNSAGVIAFGTIENTGLDAWQRMFALNVEATFDLMRLSVPHLLERSGSIVNVSSVNGIRSFPGVLAYNSSKSALDQLTRCSALELAAKGVRVNSVNPGVTRTELHTAGRARCRALRGLRGAQQDHPPHRADRHAGRGRGSRALPALRRRGLLHRRHDSGGRRPAPHLRPVMDILLCEMSIGLPDFRRKTSASSTRSRTRRGFAACGGGAGLEAGVPSRPRDSSRSAEPVSRCQSFSDRFSSSRSVTPFSTR